MTHDIFGTKRFGTHAVLVLIVLCGVAFILLIVRAQVLTRALEEDARAQLASPYYSGEMR